VAIIAILVGILAPAINSIRVSAQRAHCLNNLQQISHAARAYAESNSNRLPMAVEMYYAQQASKPKGITDASGIPPTGMLHDLLGPITVSPSRVNSDPRYPFGPNWAVQLLPYIEKGTLYATISADLKAYTAYGEEYKRRKKQGALLGPGGLIGAGGLVD